MKWPLHNTVYFAVFSLALFTICHASEITSVRHSVSPEKIRVVLEISEESQYETSFDNGRLSLTVGNTTLNGDIGNYSITDAMVDSFVISPVKGSVIINAVVNPSMESKIFVLQDPSRIVIDLLRPSTGSTSELPHPIEVPQDNAKNNKYLRHTHNIGNGISLYDLEEMVHDNIIKAKAILVDLKKYNVMPVMAVSQLKPKNSGDAIGSVLSFFGFAPEQDIKYSHFARKTVKSFLKMYEGIAGVNGSFFFADGTPVGTLIINRQIVSSPLFNRTSLIFYENGTAAINSVKMTGYLKLSNGRKISISGINQPLNGGNIIVYTPDYQKIGYNNSSTNIVVSDGKVEKISYGETPIPKNGFVISALGVAGESLKDRFRAGDPVEWFFMTNPALKGMDHIVAGGPRLVHSGKPCVTSKEENFRADVARSRADRTAAGITKQGYLILLTAEKATLNELARLMIDLGAYDAMNLDGGGSSGMVVRGKTLFGGQRPVSNAIIIRNRENSDL